jgi:hypothetical protein
MRNIAVLMVAVVLSANAQCIADCGLLPCDQQATRPVTPEPCHHQSSSDQAAPDDTQRDQIPPTDQDHSSNCGHPQFVSELGPQGASLHVDLASVALIAVNLNQALPASPIVLDRSPDRSPPLRLASALRTVLRV